MENLTWLVPLKTAVLLIYVLAFTAVLLGSTGKDDERLRRLPLDGGEEKADA